MMHRIGNRLFYLISLIYLSFYFGGIVILFHYYKLDERTIIFSSFFIYYVAVLWESHIERMIIRREKKKDTFFTIISGNESNAINGVYSLNTLIASGIPLFCIIMIRIIKPERIDLESTILSALSLGVIIYKYKKRIRIIEQIKEQNKSNYF